MLEISRIVTALGAVAASTGLTLYGVVASHVVPNTTQMTWSLWLTIVGVIATVVGVVMYRRAWYEED